MSALVTHEWPHQGETYRAKVETLSDSVRVTAEADGDVWVRICNSKTMSALMSREEAAALRDMLTEAIEAKQGVPA